MFIIGYEDRNLKQETLINISSIVEIGNGLNGYEVYLSNGRVRYIKKETYLDLRSSACEIESRR